MASSDSQRARMSALVFEPDSEDGHIFMSEEKDDFLNEGDEDSNLYALALVRLIGSSFVDIDSRIGCAATLCMLLGENDLFTWRNLSAATQSTIKCFLLDRIMVEESRPIVAELGKTVLVLGSSLIPENNWPELLPFLCRCLADSSSSNYAKVSAFLTFSGLADDVGETIVSSVKNLHSLFRNVLNDDTLNFDVRAAAMTAVISFIQSISNPNEKERFQDLLPGMMKTLTDALNNGEEGVSLKNEYPLKFFMRLAHTEPGFLRRQLVDVVATIFEIAEAECLEEETRFLAVEFLITLVEAKQRAPGMMKKLPLFIDRCFAMLLKLLLDIKDDPAWNTADIVLDKTGTTRIFHVGKGGLERFSHELGGKSIAHIAREQLCDYLLAPEWEKRHAALVALTCITKDCSKVMIKDMKQLVDMVLSCFHDSHPRVRWAACGAIIRLLFDFSPHFQEQYHNRVFLALATAVDDFHPRVQAYAMTALSAFGVSSKLETLIPHLDKIVSKMIVLIKNEKQMVQQEALRALAATAQSVKEHFQTYYDTVMPDLKAVLISADLKSNLILLARAMECISIVGSVVGKEKFRDDGKQIMGVVMSLQGLQLKMDDPTTWDMLQACARICECMGQELLTYMSAVIPFLIQCAEWHHEDYEIDDNSIKNVKFGEKKLWKKGEEKANACEMLGWYAGILKEDFYPWISQAVPILVPLLKFYIHDPVRKNAAKAMSSLLRNAKLAVAKGIAQGGAISYFIELSDCIILALVEALHEERVTEIRAAMLFELYKCLLMCQPLLSESQLLMIVGEIKHVITENSNRKRELTERAKTEDFDAEEAELLRQEKDKEDSVLVLVGPILNILMETFKSAFLPFFDELSSYLISMWGKDKTIQERTTSISTFVDLVEEFPEAATKYCDAFLPLFLDASNAESPRVRQKALYGLALYAEYGGSDFKPYVTEAISRINTVITHVRACELENEGAYNTAVFALGKICVHHRERIDSAKVFPIWLNYLPMKDYLFEAKNFHDEICSMFERLDGEIIGHNYQYLSKIISIFAEVLCFHKDFATEQTANFMISVFIHLQKTLQPATWESAWSYVLPRQEIELKSIISSEEDASF